MKTTPLLLLIIVPMVTSWAATGVFRRYALASQWLDLPTSRSSHSMPTPRGGGVAIVASFLLFVVALGLVGWVDSRLCIAIGGGGLLVAVLGFLDDRRSLPARWRFLGHAAAAGWALWCLGGIPSVPIFGALVDLSYAGAALCGLYLVWMVNLFNFMDGIDGIASVEAITTALGGALLWWLAGSGTGVACRGSVRRLRRRLPGLELSAREDFHGRRRQRLPRADGRVVVAVVRAVDARTVLGLVHPDRLLHGRCHHHAGAARAPG